MSQYWWARARLEQLRKTRPGRDIVHVTEAIVYAAEDGEPGLVRFLDECLDAFEWDPIKPKTVARNDAYVPSMVIAGACIALLAGDPRAKAYLRELAEVFCTSRKLELRAVGKLARAVDTGVWDGQTVWNELPREFDQLYRGILGCTHPSSMNVAHTPHAYIFSEAIHYLLPMCLLGAIDADRRAALASIRSSLGPGRSRRGELMYRRSDEPPKRAEVRAGRAKMGIAAIDLGAQLHVYHDGFSAHEANWTFDPDDEAVAALLQLDDRHWGQVRNQVTPQAWTTIDAKREDAVHVLAIDPRLVTISETARARAQARFGIALEIVPLLDT